MLYPGIRDICLLVSIAYWETENKCMLCCCTLHPACVFMLPVVVVCREQQPKASPAQPDGDTHQAADGAGRGPILKTPTSIPQSQAAVGGK